MRVAVCASAKWSIYMRAPASSDPAWQPRTAWDSPRLDDLLQMSDAELRSAVKGSAMSRAKPAGLRRNIAIASDNATKARLGR